MTVGWRSPLGGPRYDGSVPGERARDDCCVEHLEREPPVDRYSVEVVTVALDCKHAAHDRLGRTVG
jgi:hypothetical protein